jgi:hypothetical protein
MSSESDDSGVILHERPLYLNSDDSATTLNDTDQKVDEKAVADRHDSQSSDTITSKIIIGSEQSAEDRLVLLLLTWVIFLHRGSLTEEAQDVSWALQGTQKSIDKPGAAQRRSLLTQISQVHETGSSSWTTYKALLTNTCILASCSR